LKPPQLTKLLIGVGREMKSVYMKLDQLAKWQDDVSNCDECQVGNCCCPNHDLDIPKVSKFYNEWNSDSGVMPVNRSLESWFTCSCGQWIQIAKWYGPPCHGKFKAICSCRSTGPYDTPVEALKAFHEMGVE